MEAQQSAIDGTLPIVDWVPTQGGGYLRIPSGGPEVHQCLAREERTWKEHSPPKGLIPPQPRQEGDPPGALRYPTDGPLFPRLGLLTQPAAISWEGELERFAAAAQALQRIHAAGWILGPFTPWELLRREGQAAFCGNGLAFQPGQPPKPLPGLAILAGHAAPECTGRIAATPDHRADIYALGACYYHALTGQAPHTGTDLAEIQHAVLAQAPDFHLIDQPGIPSGIGDLLRAMLSKAPDQRPASAAAVEGQLRAILKGIDTGRAAPKPAPQLQLNAALFGREEETTLLDAALEHAKRGQKSIVAISGTAGIGKSALAHHYRQAGQDGQVVFLHGKFQQFQRSSPFLGLAEALTGGVNRLFTLGEAAYEAARQRMVEALGPNAPTFASFLPGIEWLIGQQAPQTADDDPEEQRNRLKRAFRAFLEQLIEPGKPIVLVLEDIQWAGPATFSLLEVLLEPRHLDHLLLVLTMRGSEIQDEHPYTTFAKLAASTARTTEINLRPLGPEALAKLLASALGKTIIEVTPLAKAVLQKTGGIPLFAREFILRLQRQQLIRWDSTAGQWAWDLAAVQRSEVAAGAEMMAEQYHALPAPTRQCLQVAACHGSNCHMADIAELLGRTEAEVEADLLPALEQGIVVRLPEQGMLRFAHDLPHQSAYHDLEPQAQAALHLRIVTKATRDLKAESLRQDAFQLMHHFEQCIDHINTDALRRAYLLVALEVARKERAALDFHRVHTLMEQARQFLGSLEAQERAPASLEIDLARYEAAAALGSTAQAARIHQEALAAAPDDLARVRLHLARARGHIARSELPETLMACRDGLRLLGIRLPAKGTIPGLLIEFLRVQWLLRGKTDEALKNLPPWEGQASEYLSQLLYLSLHPAYVQDPELFAILSLKALRAGIRHGIGRHSFLGFSTYATFLAVGFDDFKRAAKLYEVAQHTMERMGNVTPIVYAGMAFSRTFGHPLRDAFAWAAKSHALADASGLLREASEPLPLDTMARYHAGLPLPEVAQHGAHYLDYIATAGTAHLYDSVLVAVMGIRRLIGQGHDDLRDIEGRALSPQRLHEILNGTQYLTIRAYHLLFEVQWQFLSRHHTLAQTTMASLRKISHSVAGSFTMTEIVFTDALIHAWAGRESGLHAWRARRWARTRLRKMKKWALSAPMNFAHKVALIEALLQPGHAAAPRLMAAADAAADEGFLFHEALAAELSGRILHAAGHSDAAQTALERAIEAYTRWGSQPRVTALKTEYPEFFPASATPPASTMTAYAENPVDLVAILKASSTIASEVSLSGLLQRLIRILTEYAGAERGLLLLEEGGQWLIQARSERGNQEVSILEATPAIDSGLLSPAVLTWVSRQRERQVFSDASTTLELAEDPYVRTRAPRSVLCLPIRNQAQVTAILYLENNLNPGAFSASRLELLDILATQAAVSLENLRLYMQLEARVNERTRELSETLGNLRATQDQLVQSQKLASLGQVTAGIAHEIRNPLNFVNNFSELTVELVEELQEVLDQLKANGLPPEGTAKIEEILHDIQGNSEKIRHHGKRAESIVQNMLKHASSSSSERMPVNLNQLAHEYAMLAYHGIRGANPAFLCQISFDLDPAVGLVEMNQQDISRALLNIFQNAFQAMEERVQADPGYHPALQLRTADMGLQVAVSVQDNGPGIPKSVLDKIFDPFFTTKPTGKGTGLGLSMAYDLVVQSHHGQLLVESTEGTGTEFKIILPRKS